LNRKIPPFIGWIWYVLSQNGSTTPKQNEHYDMINV
jgi:hypothetical protein